MFWEPFYLFPDPLPLRSISPPWGFFTTWYLGRVPEFFFSLGLMWSVVAYSFAVARSPLSLPTYLVSISLHSSLVWHCQRSPAVAVTSDDHDFPTAACSSSIPEIGVDSASDFSLRNIACRLHCHEE
jgi:hypothetical protein